MANINNVILQSFEEKTSTTIVAPTYVNPKAQAVSGAASLGALGTIYGGALGIMHGLRNHGDLVKHGVTGAGAGAVGLGALGAGLGYVGSKLHNYTLKKDLEYTKNQK